MKASTIFALLGACASVATASFQPGAEEDTTTTMTSTMTMTYTLTECAPEVPDCPANTPTPTSEPEPTTESTSEPEPEPTPSSSSSIYFPIQNTTSSSGPTADLSKPPTLVTETSVVDVPSPSTTPPTTVPVSGAGSVFLQTGLLVGAVFVGMVALA